jgi:cell division protein FtsB
MPGDATRWALVSAKKKLQEAEAENARLRERIKELEGQVLDLGGDPDA